MYIDFLEKVHAGQWLQRHRRLIAVALVVVGLLIFFGGRPKLVTLQGEFLGVPYQIQYMDRWGRRYQTDTEALLATLAQAVTAELAQFNAHDCSDFSFSSPFLYEMLTRSKVAYQQTQGAFDPTVLPLLLAWEDCQGSGGPGLERVRGVQDYVCLDYVVANAQRGKKLKEGVKLDFGGLLKGYVADVATDFLQTRGVTQSQVLLGGHAVAYGWQDQLAVHPYVTALADSPWQVWLAWMGKEGAVAVSNAVGKRVIDPATGYPSKTTLLAAVVLAADGALADAYATAMVARGLAFARELSDQQGVAALLVYEGEGGAPAFYASPQLHMQQQEQVITISIATGSSN